MHVEDKLYPYPVLRNSNDDYLNSRFDMEIEAKAMATKIKLCINVVLENEEIKKLIEEGYASCYLHIECPKTSYRKLIMVSGEYQEIDVDSRSVDFSMDLVPFVLADKDIIDYKNSKFNHIYEGIGFNLEKGNIIAIGSEVPVEIDKESDNLTNVPSIFTVTEIKDKSVQDIKINNFDDKINVQLPSKTFYEFKIANNNPNSKAIIHSMIIVPGLMRCFEDMKRMAIRGEFYLCEDKRWFRGIKRALSNLGIELDDETVLTIDSFGIAQKIMDNTTNRAILGINNIAVQGGEDYD